MEMAEKKWIDDFEKGGGWLRKENEMAEDWKREMMVVVLTVTTADEKSDICYYPHITLMTKGKYYKFTFLVCGFLAACGGPAQNW